MLKAISRLVDFTSWVVGFLLFARFIMRFFGANQNTPFIEWLYKTTADLMAPFAGIFPVSKLPGGGFLDFPALVAAIIYLVIGYAIAAFLFSLEESLFNGRGRDQSSSMRSPNPVAPSVIHHPPVSEPIDPRN